MLLCPCCKAEVFGSISLQHHHRGFEGFECHRGAHRGGGGRQLHAVRVHECVSNHQRHGDSSARPEADQDGGEGKPQSHPCGAPIQPYTSNWSLPQVYLTAGAVYGLEGTLGDLEHCARSISSGTTDTELAFLEDQIATAAAQVQQSELQVRFRSPMLNKSDRLGFKNVLVFIFIFFKVSNIEARILALKTAGLNVAACNRFSKFRTKDKVRHSALHPWCTSYPRMVHPLFLNTVSTRILSSTTPHSVSPGTGQKHVSLHGTRAHA